MKKSFNSPYLLWIVLLLVAQSCKKAEIPTLTTSAITNISSNSATCGGTITDEGSGTITERGVCWSTNITPTLTDNKTNDGAGAGTFVSNLNGLNPSTTYYIRAYASNNSGTGYGMTMSFKTKDLFCMTCKMVTYVNNVFDHASSESVYCESELIAILNSGTVTIGNTKTQWECH